MKDTAATTPTESATLGAPETPGAPESAKQKKQRRRKERRRAAKERARRGADLGVPDDVSPAESTSSEDVPGSPKPAQGGAEKEKGTKQAEKKPFSLARGEFTFGVGQSLPFAQASFGQGFEFVSKFGTELGERGGSSSVGSAVFGAGAGGHGTGSPQISPTATTQPLAKPGVINLSKAEAQQLLSELQKQIVRSNTALEENRKLWAAERAGYDRQIDALKARCDDPEKSNAAMSDRNKELTQSREQVRILQDKLRTVAASAKAEATRRDVVVEELRERILSQETELGELRDRERERQALEDSEDKGKRDVEDRMQRLKVALEEQIRVLEEESDSQKELIAQKEQELDERQQKITANAAEKAELVREKGLDEQEKADLKNEIAAAESTVSRHEKTIARLKDELADLRVEMGNTQLQLSDDATTIKDLRSMVSSLRRRIDRESESGEAGSSGAQIQKEQGLIEEIERLSRQVESQEHELESIKGLGSVFDDGEGKEDDPTRKATDLVGDDGALPLSSLLGGQDFKGFLDRFNASGSRRSGRPTAITATSSLLGGNLHLSDDELVRRYNLDHPEAIFHSPEDAARLRDLVKMTPVDAAGKKALHDLMVKQSSTIKQLYEVAKIAGSAEPQTVTKDIVVEKPVVVGKPVIGKPVAVNRLPGWLHPVQFLTRFHRTLSTDLRTVTRAPIIVEEETAEATAMGTTENVVVAVEPIVSTAVAPPISSVILMIFVMAAAFCLFTAMQMNVRSNSSGKHALRPWERCHLPYPWRLLVYMNGGIAPQWAQVLRRWVVVRFDERIPPF
ncbi:MAG: hypothetical protein M1813_001457 [Trichoglossum hirsutum]|nr:MAG: hypothetical protein M1813_001457 [Trichoglossum hirsutum]